jgi:putative ABC transport system permease protein
VLRATLRSLFARRLRLLTTSIAVLLGVAFMAGTMVLTDTISKSFNDLFTSVYAGTDAFVRSANKVDVRGGPDAARARIDESVLPEVRAVDGVDFANGQVMGYTQIVGANGKALGNPGMGAPTFGTNWNEPARLNPFRIVEGRPPTAHNEVVIDKASARKGKLHIGSSTTVLFQGPAQTVTVVGIAKFGSADSPLGASFAMFTTAAAQRWIGQPGRFDAIGVKGKAGISQSELRGRIAKVMPPGIEVLTGDAITKEQQNGIQRGIRFFSTFMLVFALIALFVGSFIIHNTFSILVAQRGRELALMRAIGASRRQVLGSVLLEAVLVGGAASVLGLGVGVGVAVLLKALLNALSFEIPATGLLVTPRTIIVAFLVGVIVSVLSALSPARRAARVPPVAAMRDLAFETTAGLRRRVIVGAGVVALGVAALLYGLFGHPKNRVGPDGLGVAMIFVGVAVLGPVFAGPVSRALGAPLARYRGVAGTLARENALRNPRRTSATAAALMIGVGLIAFVIIFASSAKASFADAIARQFSGDFVVASNSQGFGGLSPDVEDRLRPLPEVKAISPIRFAPVEVDRSKAFVAGVDRRTFGDIVDIDVRDGSLADLKLGTVAVKDSTARKHHWKIGSTITMHFPQAGDQPLRVAALFHKTDLVPRYLTGLETYGAYAGDQFDVGVVIDMASGVKPAQARRAIEHAVAAYPTAKVQDETEYIASQTGQVNQLLGLIYVLLLLAVVIAVLGIANTLALSIHERTRELGLLRAVGMLRRQLRSAVRWESVIIAVLGAVLGLVIGLFFGWILVTAAKSQGIHQFRVPFGSLIFVTVVAAIAGVLAAIVPARRASRLNVLTAIATE